jgi:DNA-binding response OmpR family regulator
MSSPPQSLFHTKTSIAPMLSVRRGAKAVEFYKEAFGATESFRMDDPSGAVVARLSVEGAEFWVADESPEHKNFSPETLSGSTVRVVLVVDDEDHIVELARLYLTREGYEVEGVGDGSQALARFGQVKPDLVVLDIMLPGFDGLEVCRRIQAERPVPVIMLTARDDENDLLAGLAAGADDYLTKPFSIDVLLARIRAVSRRGAIARPVCLEVADLRLDPGSHRVTRAGSVLNLTPREYSLLELLMRNAGRAVSRDTILESVWGVGSAINENTLEVFMRLLRMKVDNGETKLIHTVRGFGYMMG